MGVNKSRITLSNKKKCVRRGIRLVSRNGLRWERQAAFSSRELWTPALGFRKDAHIIAGFPEAMPSGCQLGLQLCGVSVGSTKPAPAVTSAVCCSSVRRLGPLQPALPACLAHRAGSTSQLCCFTWDKRTCVQKRRDYRQLWSRH